MENKFTIEDLREGRCAVINDGTIEELREVVCKAFPNDEMLCNGMAVYYFRNAKSHGNWISYNATALPVQSVRDFLPKTYTLTEISALFFDLIGKIPEGELRNWDETDFAAYLAKTF